MLWPLFQNSSPYRPAHYWPGPGLGSMLFSPTPLPTTSPLRGPATPAFAETCLDKAIFGKRDWTAHKDVVVSKLLEAG